jgi:hypothetical protein
MALISTGTGIVPPEIVIVSLSDQRARMYCVRARYLIGHSYRRPTSFCSARQRTMPCSGLLGVARAPGPRSFRALASPANNGPSPPPPPPCALANIQSVKPFQPSYLVIRQQSFTTCVLAVNVVRWSLYIALHIIQLFGDLKHLQFTREEQVPSKH